LILLLSPPLFAQIVYKTVEDGVTSFSDTPPEDGEAQTLTINPPAPADDGLLDKRLAAMRDTTDRMAADRREREQHRAEMRALQQPTTEPVASGGVQTPAWSQGYWPNYLGAVRPRPPFHPWRPSPAPLPSPGRPGVEGAAPPGWSVMQPGNAQLMRPIVSTRN
jgi:hypothetical protein